MTEKKQPEPEPEFHVVEFPATKGRGVVHVDALEGVLAGGLEDVGETSDRYREPVLTDSEWAAQQTPSGRKSKKQPTSPEGE